MIPQRNLSLLANRLAASGGRRLPEAVLERDYCLGWFLVGLSRAPLRDHLAFKGGTALKRCYIRHAPASAVHSAVRSREPRQFRAPTKEPRCAKETNIERC